VLGAIARHSSDPYFVVNSMAAPTETVHPAPSNNNSDKQSASMEMDENHAPDSNNNVEQPALTGAVICVTPSNNGDEQPEPMHIEEIVHGFNPDANHTSAASVLPTPPWKVLTQRLVDRKLSKKQTKISVNTPVWGCEFAFMSNHQCNFALCSWCKQEEHAAADLVPETLLTICKRHRKYVDLSPYSDKSYFKCKYTEKNPNFAHVCVKCGLDFCVI